MCKAYQNLMYWCTCSTKVALGEIIMHVSFYKLGEVCTPDFGEGYIYFGYICREFTWLDLSSQCYCSLFGIFLSFV